MSEFGNETATATLRLSEKTLEALLKLLKFMMERNKKSIESELKKEELKNLKSENAKKKVRRYLNNKKGNVRANMLYKSGEKLLPISIPLSVADLRKFEKYAKMYGMTYTSIADKRIAKEIKNIKDKMKETDDEVLISTLKEKLENLEKERQKRIVIIREKDLEITKEITDKMNMDIQLKDIDNEINIAQNIGNVEAIAELSKEKEDIKRNVFDKFNTLSNKIVLAEIAGDTIEEKIDFNRAIANVTNLKDLNNTSILCERTNPKNFIEATSSQEISKDGREYINTEYKVFNQNQEQKCSEFEHGKFMHYSTKEGENTSEIGDKHWENMKIEMKEKGDFSNDLLIFRDKESYEKYLNDFTKIEEKFINREDVITFEADSNSYVDCQGIINNLSGQLSDHNLMMNAKMELMNVKTKKVVHLNKNMADDEKIKCSEGLNIVEQINNYKSINDLQNKIEMTKFEMGEETSSDIITSYENKIKKMKQELELCNKKARQLELQQKKIKAVAVVGFVEYKKALEETIESKEVIKESGHNKSVQPKAKWEKDIKTYRVKSINTQSKTTKTKSKELSIE